MDFQVMSHDRSSVEAVVQSYPVAMKLKDGWQIVSKSYRYDLRE
jgi:hypothetical protein